MWARRPGGADLQVTVTSLVTVHWELPAALRSHGSEHLLMSQAPSTGWTFASESSESSLCSHCSCSLEEPTFVVNVLKDKERKP